MGGGKFQFPFSNRSRKLFEHYSNKISDLFLKQKWKSLFPRRAGEAKVGSARTGSGVNPEEKTEETNEEVQKSGRDGDSDDDSDSDNSVISLASTESQK